MNKLRRVFFLFCLVFVSYSCNETKIIGEYESGQIKLECEIKDGRRDGECIGYYPNGEKKFISNYEDDTLNGISKFFHKSGNLHWEVNFENGVKSGEIKYFDSLGKIYQQSSFKNNKLDGKSFSFYSNGILKEEMNYKNGYLDGAFKSYFEDGSLKTNAKYFKDDLLDFITYDSLGRIINHDIKYKLEDDLKDSVLVLNVTILNKVFDVVGVEVSIKTKDDVLEPVETKYSEDNSITLKKKLNEDMHLVDTLYLKIFEIENMEGNGNGVVRSVKIVHYPLTGASL